MFSCAADINLDACLSIAKTAQDFLSFEKREFVLDLYDTDDPKFPEQRNDLRILLHQLSVILRVTSQEKKVDCKAFHEFNIDTYLKVMKFQNGIFWCLQFFIETKKKFP